MLGTVLAKLPAGLSPGAGVPAPREPPTPVLLGLWDFLSWAPSIIPVSPGSLPSGGWGDAESSQPLSRLIFLVTTPPPLHQEPPGVTS